jgi:hypothetical protein
MIMTRRIQTRLFELAELLGEEPEDKDAVEAKIAEIRAMAKASAALFRAAQKLRDHAIGQIERASE